MSGVNEIPLLIELGVVDGVVDDGNTAEDVSTSNLTGGFPGKSILLLIAAVVSVDYT